MSQSLERVRLRWQKVEERVDVAMVDPIGEPKNWLTIVFTLTVLINSQAAFEIFFSNG